MQTIAPLVVSQRLGNDELGARFGVPYRTLGAAKNAALPGDTIVVSDGTFNERNLLKDGVNWSFLAGTKVSYQGSYPESGADRAIFDDADGPVRCRIDGAGEFVWSASNDALATAAGVSGAVLWLQHSASAVAINGCRAAIGQFANIGQDTYGILVENCAQLYAVFEIIENDAGPGGPFAWLDGNVNLRSTIIRAGQSSYSVWAREPAAGSAVNGYVEADLIDNPGYAAVRLEGVTSNYRLWIRAKEIRGRSGGASIGAIQQSGGGKLYLDAEKIENTSLGAEGATVRVSPAIYVTGGEAWIRVQKITTNLNAALTQAWLGQAVTCDAVTDRIGLSGHIFTGFELVRFGGTQVPAGLVPDEWYYPVNATANSFQVATSPGGPAIDLTDAGTGVRVDTIPWAMYATVIGGRVNLDCPHFEQVGDHPANAFGIGGGMLKVRGLQMSPVGNGRGVVHLGSPGGGSQITGLSLDTSATDAAANRPVELTGSGLVLDQCRLIAPPLADSIYSVTPQNVTCYGVKANRAVNANVTARVDLTVDADTA